ncbi:MAG: Asp23/Gls24 family envelope stress response protein [Oscillospiraceae bacterium]|nr:Asp23/Gls24 family envelope stress response protein [Oscillospiraceae bacterium]
MSEKSENIIHTDENGTIHISEDVVASIAALAATEVEGVASLSTGTEWLGRKNLTRGVKITLEERRATLTVSLSVRYGFPVQTVARQVQEKVREAVESMTGLVVAGVDVNVSGVSFDKSKESKAPKTAGRTPKATP